MKYKFTVQKSLDIPNPEEIVPGLQVAAIEDVRVIVDVNTELPADKIPVLKQKVEALIGSSVELSSSEI